MAAADGAAAADPRRADIVGEFVEALLKVSAGDPDTVLTTLDSLIANRTAADYPDVEGAIRARFLSDVERLERRVRQAQANLATSERSVNIMLRALDPDGASGGAGGGAGGSAAAASAPEGEGGDLRSLIQRWRDLTAKLKLLELDFQNSDRLVAELAERQQRASASAAAGDASVPVAGVAGGGGGGSGDGGGDGVAVWVPVAGEANGEGEVFPAPGDTRDDYLLAVELHGRLNPDTKGDLLLAQMWEAQEYGRPG